MNQSPIGLTARGAFLCLLFLPPASPATPFATQDQNPFSLINGQPQPLPAEPPGTDRLHWSLALDITNTLNVETTGSEALLLDFESYVTRLNLHYGLQHGWSVMLDIPLIDRGGGFLDGAIDSWHDTFGLPQANRPNVVSDKFRIRYVNNGVTVIDTGNSTGGIGDIQLGLGHGLLQTNETAISTWLVADLPSGDFERLTGNEATDFSLLLAGSHRYSPQWQLDANAGLLLPGNSSLRGLEIEDEVLFGHVALAWSPSDAFDLRVQLSGHTQYYTNSTLKLMGNAYNIVFGGSLHIDDCTELDIGVSEDIMVGATPDVSFLFNWRRRECHQAR